MDGSLLKFVTYSLILILAAELHAADRNVVLFVTDDQGCDAGCYGNDIIQTPNLDQLAADGTLYTHAFCTTASCSASRSVILTGLFNHRNRQYGHTHAYHHFISDQRIESLPVRLSRAGYRTARIGKFHVEPAEVYRFDVVLPDAGRNTVQMAENCADFVVAESEQPFFLYFCTTDPHRGGGFASEKPYAPDRFGNRPTGYPGVETVDYSPHDVMVPRFLPDTSACRAELAEYYQSVSRVDQGLGRLVQLLKDAGQWDKTLLVYISDHGIAFPGAKTTVYEPGLRAPCVIRDPQLDTRGSQSSAMISWVDLTPTILDYAGAPPAAGEFHGRSFLSTLGRENPSGWDEVYASHTFHEITMYYPMRVVRERRFKLIWNIAHPLPYPFASDLWAAPTWQNVFRQGRDALYGQRKVGAYLQRPRFELYDLEHDPDEIKNLADDPQHAEKLASLQAKLRAFQERTEDPWILKWDYE